MKKAIAELVTVKPFWRTGLDGETDKNPLKILSEGLVNKIIFNMKMSSGNVYIANAFLR